MQNQNLLFHIRLGSTGVLVLLNVREFCGIKENTSEHKSKKVATNETTKQRPTTQHQTKMAKLLPATALAAHIRIARVAMNPRAILGTFAHLAPLGLGQFECMSVVGQSLQEHCEQGRIIQQVDGINKMSFK